jgi:pimeloyl-ACP methyl ester carboxylesterase
MTEASTAAKHAANATKTSAPPTEDTPLLPTAPTEMVDHYEESLVFSLIFVLPSTIFFAITLIACITPTTWSVYQFFVSRWHYSGSLPLTCWILLYPIVWSLPPIINVLAWHGIFKKPLTLPELQPKIPSTRVGRQLLAWSVPRALLFLNIVFLIGFAITILVSKELRGLEWTAALAAIWGAFVLTWVSSQINFYARRRVKRLMDLAETVHLEEEQEEIEAREAAEAESSYLTQPIQRSRTNSTSSSGKSELLTAASKPSDRPKIIARIPTNHRRLLPARIPLYRLTTETTLHLLSFVAIFLFANTVIRALEISKYPPPGQRFISQDGTLLHIHCQGSNQLGDYTVPTVVFEPGASVLASHHAQFLADLEKEGKIGRYCWYDRAGYGWSASGALPATAEYAADQAYELLVQNMKEENMILVGHSYGGMIVRLFAAKYPEYVSGVILLDASHEDELLWTEVRTGHSATLEWAVRKWQWSCALYDFVWLVLEPLGMDRFIPIWSIGDEGWSTYGEATKAGLLNGRALQVNMNSFLLFFFFPLLHRMIPLTLLVL